MSGVEGGGGASEGGFHGRRQWSSKIEDRGEMAELVVGEKDAVDEGGERRVLGERRRRRVGVGVRRFVRRDRVADDHNVEASSARSKSSPADASAASKTATAAAANTGRRSGRVSSPTRAKLVPQYSQCSYTDAKAPPSNTRGSVASTNSTYFEILCVAQLYKSALPARLASPSVSSEKIALYCITRSNSATRCVSVSFFR